MFNIKEKFEFLEDGVDFPFYNDIPKLSTKEWSILAVSAVIFIVLCCIELPKFIHALLYCFVLLIPALYICKGNYNLFFKKPRLKDFKTIILCFIGYLIYSIIIGFILTHFGYHVVGDSNGALATSMMFYVSLFIQLVGEELFKVFILLIVMYLVYKKTKNRSKAIYAGILTTLIIFGIAHFSAYSGRILQIILIQGFGTIFNLYAYMKTKNVVVSYLVHILIDLSSFSFITVNHIAPMC